MRLCLQLRIWLDFDQKTVGDTLTPQLVLIFRLLGESKHSDTFMLLAQLSFDRVEDGLEASGDVELPENAVQMALDRLLAYE